MGDTNRATSHISPFRPIGYLCLFAYLLALRLFRNRIRTCLHLDLQLRQSRAVYMGNPRAVSLLVPVGVKCLLMVWDRTNLLLPRSWIIAIFVVHCLVPSDPSVSCVSFCSCMANVHLIITIPHFFLLWCYQPDS